MIGKEFSLLNLFLTIKNLIKLSDTKRYYLKKKTVLDFKIKTDKLFFLLIIFR